LLAIEEDFASTRKIAKARIASRRDLIQALAPLLSVQNGIGIGIQDAPPNPTERFRDWPKAALEALSGDASAGEVLSLMMRDKWRLVKSKLKDLGESVDASTFPFPQGSLSSSAEMEQAISYLIRGDVRRLLSLRVGDGAKSQVYVHPGRGAACAPWF
jgi:hypothetical protein